MLRYHPRYYDNYQVHDQDIRETCCTVGLCDIFYSRRPQQNCNGYRPPPWSEFISILYNYMHNYVHYVCTCAYSYVLPEFCFILMITSKVMTSICNLVYSSM